MALALARGPNCEKCHNDNFAIIQVHHIIERSVGGTDDHTNLQLLCPNCHMTHHYGFFRFEDTQVYKTHQLILAGTYKGRPVKKRSLSKTTTDTPS